MSHKTYLRNRTIIIAVFVLCAILLYSIPVISYPYLHVRYDTTGQFIASRTDTDTTNFDNNLSSADDTVQKALETLDEATGSGSKWLATGEVLSPDTSAGYHTLALTGTANTHPLIDLVNNSTEYAIELDQTGNQHGVYLYNNSTSYCPLVLQNKQLNGFFLRVYDYDGTNYMDLRLPPLGSNMQLHLPEMATTNYDIIYSDTSGHWNFDSIHDILEAAPFNALTIGDGTSDSYTWTFDTNTGTPPSFTITPDEWQFNNPIKLDSGPSFGGIGSGADVEWPTPIGTDWVFFHMDNPTSKRVYQTQPVEGQGIDLMLNSSSMTIAMESHSNTFAFQPPAFGFNPTEGLTVPSGAGFATNWTWVPTGGGTQTYLNNVPWLESTIMDDYIVPATDIATVTVWGHLPYDFAGWDATTAFRYYSRAGVTSWGSSNGELEIKIYNTNGSLDYTESKTSWGAANVFEWTTVDDSNLTGTWAPGGQFFVKISSKRNGATGTGGGTMEILDISFLQFKYDKER